MQSTMHYNFKDIPRALRIGFSIKKIWVQFTGLAVGIILYAVCSYLALLTSGYQFTEIWNTFHCLPLPYLGYYLTLGGKILLALGILLLFISYLVSGVAISKITYEQLKGDEFYEVKKAWGFAFKEGKSVIFAPLVLFLLIVFILLCGVILGLLGKLPFGLGELMLVIFAIPAILAVFFLIYLAMIFTISLVLSPAVIATTNSDTFDTLFELFSSFNEQNWRFFTYEGILYGLKILGTGLLAFFTGRTLGIIHAILGASWLSGEKFKSLALAGLAYLPNLPFKEYLYPLFNLLGIETLLEFQLFPQLPLLQTILGFIWGILLCGIILLVISYWGSIHWVGNTLLFIILAKKKDDIELLKTKEKEETKSEAIPQTTEEGKKEEEEKSV